VATGRIGTTPVLTTRWSKAPAGGTTSLSGLDDNSVSLVYSVGYEAVYRNGVLLSRGNDYTATNGTSITLTDATIAGDIIEVFANQTIPLTDTYSQTVSDGRFIKNTLTTTTGDIIYASAANTPARLGIGSTNQVLTVSGGVPTWITPSSGTPAFVGCFLYKASNQSISDDTSTVLTFTAEEIDTDGFHDNSTNTSRITIPSGKGGKYLFIGYASFAPNASGSRAISFIKNGSSTIASPTRIFANTESGSDTRVNGQIIANLNAGDYVEMTGYQKSGGSLNVQGDSVDTFRTKFGCVYLGA